MQRARWPMPGTMSGPAGEDRSPLVSVVVPMHNAGDRIATTLRSVVGQSYTQLELVLVDDGSQDDTRVAAARTLSGCPLNWRLIEIPNQGPSRARNLGWPLLPT